MKSLKFTIIYGFLLWLVPFIVSFIIFPLKESQSPLFETTSPLFETIMPVTLTFFVVFFSILYFRKIEIGYFFESIKLGIVWFAISFVIDLLMFMWGPMKMPFLTYMSDIGLTYLIFPIVTIGFGYLRSLDLQLKNKDKRSC